jgi:fibronectin-binding autotransporter adhesin
MGDSHDANPGNGIAADANGMTTLRAAIEECNALGGNQTIGFSGMLVGTVVLTLGASLDVTANITINGTGLGVQPAANAAPFSIIDIHGGSTCTISQLKFRHGNAGLFGDGGGVYNSGDLTLQNVEVSYNQAGVSGGGIFNPGTLNMDHCLVEANESRDGGGIFNTGTMLITNSTTITLNSAVGGDGGGIFNFETATCNLSGSDVTSNNATTFNHNGGGINNLGTLTMSGGNLSGNGAYNYGGGIYIGEGASAVITSVGIIGNGAGAGGGFFLYEGYLELGQSTLDGNFAGVGNGGVIVDGIFVDDGGNIINDDIV